MRFFAIFWGLIFLAGCSAICPSQKASLLQDQIDYTTAIDHFLLTEKMDKLINFTRVYPDSPWTERANVVIRYAHEREELLSEIEAFRLSDVEQRADLEKMVRENQKLTEKLKEFKGVLIQLEAQPQ